MVYDHYGVIWST